MFNALLHTITEQKLLQKQRAFVCREGILSKDIVKVFPWKKTDQYMIPLIQKNNECQLHFYNKPDMVMCLDALTSMTDTTKKTNGTKKIHVAFIGDSRIHQIFINLILPVN